MLEAQAMRLKTLAAHPDELSVRRDLARGYFNLANTELGAAELERQDEPYRQRLQNAIEDLGAGIDAYQQLHTSQRELDTQRELANCFRVRADANFRAGEYEAAGTDYQQAERQLRILSERNPSVSRYRTLLAETQFNYCQYLSSFGCSAITRILLSTTTTWPSSNSRSIVKRR